MIFSIIANSITSLSLIAGVSSILFAISYRFYWASGFIALSVLFDILDGRIARFNPLPSEFGKEFDSLADMISFGVAPAVLLYTFAFKDELRVVYLIILFMYVITGAYRLARYNIYSRGKISDYFNGLPITASGGFMSGMVLWLRTFNIDLHPTIFVAIIFIISLLMTSTIKYPNFSNIDAVKGIGRLIVKSTEGIKGIVLLVIFCIIAKLTNGLIIFPLFLLYLSLAPFLVKENSG